MAIKREEFFKLEPMEKQDFEEVMAFLQEALTRIAERAAESGFILPWSITVIDSDGDRIATMRYVDDGKGGVAAVDDDPTSQPVLAKPPLRIQITDSHGKVLAAEINIKKKVQWIQ